MILALVWLVAAAGILVGYRRIMVLTFSPSTEIWPYLLVAACAAGAVAAMVRLAPGPVAPQPLVERRGVLKGLAFIVLPITAAWIGVAAYVLFVLPRFAWHLSRGVAFRAAVPWTVF